MKRRRGSGRFSQVGAGGEEINPMDGVANMADVMLVFVCGLLLALITYWNVDIGSVSAVPDVSRQEITEDLGGLSDEDKEALESDGLEEYGKVYKDPATGKLYMTTE